MQLKEYQISALDRLETFLEELKKQGLEAQDFEDYQKSKGKKALPMDICDLAWKQLQEKKLLPIASQELPWIIRKDGLNRSIPHICLKIPTGGGKTILATESLGRISSQYLQKQTGFVLWIVPSDAIYQQTLKRFRDREDPYRQSLEKASGGRTKILEKHDLFSPLDVKNYLCVMILMLQSSSRETKEQLRMFRDSSGFMQFFPETDDIQQNEALLQKVQNLEILKEEGVFESKTIKQSLGNTLRLIQPIIILDEGHRAYSEIARNTISDFNPSFILELSATPNLNERHSNLLVDIAGKDLKREQMIKLPICLQNLQDDDWQLTLKEANERLKLLLKDAERLFEKEGRYIRPIMLIRVDRTGKATQKTGVTHSDQVTEFLQKNLGIPREEIKLKTASVDELKDEDLTSSFSKTKFIITKDALKEGWDCPFVYILTSLSKTTARTTLTQMIGRILRQPNAQETGIQSLDQCYIFCFDQDVSKAVTSIKDGLMDEGLQDLAHQVTVLPTSSKRGSPTSLPGSRKIPRRKEFQGLQLFLPRIVTKATGGDWRVFDYERDILANIDWDKFSFKSKAIFNLIKPLQRTFTSIDISSSGKYTSFNDSSKSEIFESTGEIDLAYLTRLLMDIVPNPWQAARITEEALNACYASGRTPRDLYPVRIELSQSIKEYILTQVNSLSEEIFRALLHKGDIQFRLTEQFHEGLDWSLSEYMETMEDGLELKHRSGQSIKKGLFEEYQESSFNETEKDVALFLDEDAAIRWWHRLVAKKEGEYSLSGWQKQKIYPDLLVCIKSDRLCNARYLVLETKGEFLAGNSDTEYKNRLFELLNSSQDNIIESGEFTFENIDKPVTFKMLLHNKDMKNNLSSVLKKNKRK